MDRPCAATGEFERTQDGRVRRKIDRKESPAESKIAVDGRNVDGGNWRQQEGSILHGAIIPRHDDAAENRK